MMLASKIGFGVRDLSKIRLVSDVLIAEGEMSAGVPLSSRKAKWFNQARRGFPSF